jgi:hypothetical protein
MEFPLNTVCKLGESDSVKSGNGSTTRVTPLVSTRGPDVIDTPIVYVPGAMVLLVAAVMVNVPPPVIIDGLKLTVTPAGTPDALGVT